MADRSALQRVTDGDQEHRALNARCRHYEQQGPMRSHLSTLLAALVAGRCDFRYCRGADPSFVLRQMHK